LFHDVPTLLLFSGNIKIANYLQIPYVPGVGELAVFCGALVGAGLGFLWYNTYPAQVFMGDVGSLSLGGALGTVAVMTKQELLLLIVGGLFVMKQYRLSVRLAGLGSPAGNASFEWHPSTITSSSKAGQNPK